ncbi:hypothetical protein [Ottowia sp.]|uniref:hypothetical protein n=1 Tax=Ottowia sp. TaxID=1898956 RepID=UPI003A8B7644
MSDRSPGGSLLARAWQALQDFWAPVMRVWRALARRLCPMKRSVLAFLISAGWGLLGMGLLGLALYYAVLPALWPWFLPESQWHGDWVWPAMIGVGMLWSLGFLIARVLNLRLQAR